MARRGLRLALSLVLTGCLVALFLWNVDLSQVVRVLEDARPGLLISAVALALLTYWLRALRWQLILAPVGSMRHSSVVLATVVGYAAMALLPARMGDIVRPWLLANRERAPFSACLASVLTERIFDLWTVVLFYLVFVVWPPHMADLDQQAARNLRLLSLSGYAAAAAIVAGTVVLLALFRYQERFVALVAGPVRRFRQRWGDALARFLGHFLDGLRILQRPRNLAVAVLSSALLWLVIYLQLDVTLRAFSLEIPFRGTFLLVALAVIGLAIPTPGGVGGFHKATQLGLTMFFAVELNRASAVAIAHHAICFLPITAIGLLCMPAIGLSLRQVDNLAAPQDRDADDASLVP